MWVIQNKFQNLIKIIAYPIKQQGSYFSEGISHLDQAENLGEDGDIWVSHLWNASHSLIFRIWKNF